MPDRSVSNSTMKPQYFSRTCACIGLGLCMLGFGHLNATEQKAVIERPGEEFLSMHQVITEVLKHSALLKKRQVDHEAARQRLRFVPERRSPELRLGYSKEDGDINDDNTYRAGIRFYPRNPWIKRLEKELARAHIVSLAAAEEEEKRRLTSLTRLMVNDIVFLKDHIQVLESIRRVHEKIKQLTEKQMESGQVPGLDYLESARDFLNAAEDVGEEKARLLEAEVALEIMMGRPVKHLRFQPEDLEKGVIRRLKGVDQKKDMTALISSRSAMVEVEGRRRMAQARYERASLKMPWIDHIEPEYGKSERERQYSIGVSIGLPFISRDRSLRKAEWLQLESEKNLLKKNIESQIRMAQAELGSAQQRWQEFRQQMAPLIVKLQKVIGDAKSRASMDPLQMEQSEIHLLKLKRKQIRLKYRYRRAYLMLEEKTANGRIKN